MQKITFTLFTLIIVLFLLCGNFYAQENERSFSDRLIQAATEKDPIKRLEMAELLMAEGNDYERFVTLNLVAKAAISAENYKKAKDYSIELLQIAPQYQDDWNYGNAVHDGHLVLGRIAVKNGDLEKAKEHLLLAGKTPGSAQLKTFGPNMSLANDLLEAGEKKTVIEYFKDCKKFWKMNDGRLDSWIASIRGGGKSYFGTNLQY